jgi:cytoskeletal protein CcmA (bactofilin family)
MSLFKGNEAKDKAIQDAAITLCNIAKDTIITGNLTTSEDLRIDGTIKGDVYCAKKLVMDSTGKIEGNVNAASADISGQIYGKVTIDGVLHLLETAFVNGTITAKQLNVDDGAKYQGETKIG